MKLLLAFLLAIILVSTASAHENRRQQLFAQLHSKASDTLTSEQKQNILDYAKLYGAFVEPLANHNAYELIADCEKVEETGEGFLAYCHMTLCQCQNPDNEQKSFEVIIECDDNGSPLGCTKVTGMIYEFPRREVSTISQELSNVVIHFATAYSEYLSPKLNTGLNKYFVAGTSYDLTAENASFVKVAMRWFLDKELTKTLFMQEMVIELNENNVPHKVTSIDMRKVDFPSRTTVHLSEDKRKRALKAALKFAQEDNSDTLTDKFELNQSSAHCNLHDEGDNSVRVNLQWREKDVQFLADYISYDICLHTDEAGNPKTITKINGKEVQIQIGSKNPLLNAQQEKAAINYAIALANFLEPLTASNDYRFIEKHEYDPKSRKFTIRMKWRNWESDYCIHDHKMEIQLNEEKLPSQLISANGEEIKLPQRDTIQLDRNLRIAAVYYAQDNLEGTVIDEKRGTTLRHLYLRQGYTLRKGAAYDLSSAAPTIIRVTLGWFKNEKKRYPEYVYDCQIRLDSKNQPCELINAELTKR